MGIAATGRGTIDRIALLIHGMLIAGIVRIGCTDEMLAVFPGIQWEQDF
jgi:hypothetical protein